MKFWFIFALCFVVDAKDQAAPKISMTHEVYQGSPKTELWVGKKRIQEGSSLFQSGTKDLKTHISSIKNVLNRLKEVEKHMSSSIEQAEAEHKDYVDIKQGSEEKIEKAIQSFKDTVNSFDKVRGKTAKTMQQGAQDVSLGSFQVEDAAKQTATKRMQQAEQSLQKAQDMLRKGGKASESAPTRLTHAPYSLSNRANLKRIFYNGVCGGDGSIGCLEYAVMLLARPPDCVSVYTEDTFPVLAALRCAILPACSGFSYMIRTNKFMSKVAATLDFWSEDYEYLTDVGIVDFYDQDMVCPVPPNKAEIPYDVGRPNTVLYYKFPKPRFFLQTNSMSKLRNFVMGGGGCFSVLSQAGYFSGVQALQAAGSMALASSSSGGSWLMGLLAVKGGGFAGSNWHETWDSMIKRENLQGNRPVWQILYKLYNNTESNNYLAEDQLYAQDKMLTWMRCKSKTFSVCNGRYRPKGEMSHLLGVAYVCARSQNQFRHFLQKYMGATASIYASGGSISSGGSPRYFDGGGALGYNLMGNVWAGIVKGWLFIPNGIVKSIQISFLGWAFAGRWVSCVTHFTRAFAGNVDKQKNKNEFGQAFASPVIPIHRYMRAMEMINPRSHGAYAGSFVTIPTLVSAVADSSNIATQTMLDLIWMLESNMCDFKISFKNVGSTARASLEAILAITETIYTPLFAIDKGIGRIWNSFNELDKENYALTNYTSWSGADHDPGLDDINEWSVTEPFQTPSPMVMQIAYYLPKNGMGFAGDASTTDDAGLLTAIHVMDEMVPAFRPTAVICLVTSTHAWYFQRYWRKEARMYDTFVPLADLVKERGIDCEKGKSVSVTNPYHIFSGPEPDTDQAVIESIGVGVEKNKMMSITGGFRVDVTFFTLKYSEIDTWYLGWMPSEYVDQLISRGFPSYDNSLENANDMFAVDFIKGFSLFGTTAFRGYMSVCSLATLPANFNQVHSKEDGEGRLKHCMKKSTLWSLFHNEDVVTTLLTVTPSKYNPFEPLRANIDNFMRGYAFWGMLAPQNVYGMKASDVSSYDYSADYSAAADNDGGNFAP